MLPITVEAALQRELARPLGWGATLLAKEDPRLDTSAIRREIHKISRGLGDPVNTDERMLDEKQAAEWQYLTWGMMEVVWVPFDGRQPGRFVLQRIKRNPSG